MVKKSEIDLWNKIKPLAREKRHAPTPAEARLWEQLRGRGVDGYKFRRQQAIGRYIVDFFCPKANLVIEVDGAIHLETVDEDAARQAELETRGFRIIRFTNDEVFGEIEAVLERIRIALLPRNIG